jgi:hypothetical protein
MDGLTTEIPSGSYIFTRDVVLDALNLFQGGMLYGEQALSTFYWEYKDGVVERLAPLMAGDLQINKSGDTYTINMDFEDDRKEPDTHSVTGSYTGPLTYSIYGN